jgi:tRNA-splicing ligase RtcB
MEWEKKNDDFLVPIKSWCSRVEDGAMQQAQNLARHRKVFGHVALMPDCHQGFGMPIGGVIACRDAVIPNAVGVDIGCGMGAVRTDLTIETLGGEKRIRRILDAVKRRVPLGEGNAHKHAQPWSAFEQYLEQNDISLTEKRSKARPGWLDDRCWDLALRNLETLGGGNHFIEIQKSEEGGIWLMLHSGSRNLGYRIASHYHKLALAMNEKHNEILPARDLAFLESDSAEGGQYIRDMQFALSYAAENRRRMLAVFKEAVVDELGAVGFPEEINIHHNYAAREEHFGRSVWVHRKGATQARRDQKGIIPGSMGTASYVVLGLGNPQSFESSAHGAGRKMGRKEACRKLPVDKCRKLMEGVVYDGFRRISGRRGEGAQYDLEEAPLAYKDIDSVIREELDLVTPIVKLRPLGVLKG